MPIDYFSEDTVFQMHEQHPTTHWLSRVAQQEGYGVEQLNLIFCSDRYLYGLNTQYLNHDTLTDVITFDYARQSQSIVADMYISIDRIKENAQCYEKSDQEELRLVMVHGLLHLVGYGDQTKQEKEQMRAKEQFYLAQWPTQ